MTLIWAYPVYLGCCRTAELSALNRQTEIVCMIHIFTQCSFKSPVSQHYRKTVTRFDLLSVHTDIHEHKHDVDKYTISLTKEIKKTAPINVALKRQDGWP